MSQLSPAPPAPLGRGVYCNRTLNLRSIRAIGYDMDYTLVHYSVEDWERRAYEHLRRRLAEDGFPVGDLSFDAALVARGVVVDTELGNLLKANRFGYVKTAYHGTRRLPFEQLRSTYMREIVDLSNKRYRFLNTLFSLSEASMYAQLVDRLEDGALREPLGYHELWRIVRARIDEAHTMGELKDEIMRQPERFVQLDADTIPTLLDQRHSGKKLLLITNSEWRYTHAMMTHLTAGQLPEGWTWKQLFDVTIVAARKPSFFDGDAPLLRVVNDEGLLEPHLGPLEAHGCYFGGSAAVVEKYLGMSGDELLYLGDHMYGDVHVSKSALRWRTGLIVRELEDELRAVEETYDEQAELAQLMRRKESMEREQAYLRLLQQRVRDDYGDRPDVDAEEFSAAAAKIKRELSTLDETIAPLAMRAGEAHNSRWGLLMRAGNDKSQLARQIERWADVYTSRVSNFSFVTPFGYLRSRRGSLPHDPMHYMNPPPSRRS